LVLIGFVLGVLVTLAGGLGPGTDPNRGMAIIGGAIAMGLSAIASALDKSK
jgi:hypothetical protein